MLQSLREALSPVLLGIIAAFAVSFALGPAVIPWLHRLKFGQNVREDGPASHLKKQGVPTMGGVAFWAAVAVGCVVPLIFQPKEARPLAAAAYAYALGNSLLGFLDDYLKVARNNSKGLKAKQKLLGQFILTLGLAGYVHHTLGGGLYLPWGGVWQLGWWIVPLIILGGIGFTNAGNLLDGLDGLLSTVTAVVCAAMALILAALARSVGETDPVLAQKYIGLAIFSGAAAGSCLAFLRVNAHPATLFMGDTGSMFLGGAIVAVYSLSGLALLLPLMGALYLVTAASVLLQVGYYKRTKKRILRMAPLHHHLELGGMSEPRIVSMYGIITVVLCLAGILVVSV
ncbi:MAG: phospho-N-acetylmuramoyl-pentapeptide-transferase [Clostridia bacterium]|nr:phospho-N-acetylmuramoyl-pentapeptide-transferase [Clostridia bacterium]